MSPFSLRWLMFWKKKAVPVPEQDLIAARLRRVAESLLENETLTADLDDDAGRALLEWGLACARSIAQSTEAVNDIDADEAMAPRLRALRQMMRSINKWAATQAEMDEGAREVALERVIAQAATIYDRAFIPPDESRRRTLIQEMSGLASPTEMVVRLRKFIET